MSTDATLGGTPAASSQVAAVWRASCSVIGRSFALLPLLARAGGEPAGVRATRSTPSLRAADRRAPLSDVPAPGTARLSSASSGGTAAQRDATLRTCVRPSSTPHSIAPDVQVYVRPPKADDLRAPAHSVAGKRVGERDVEWQCGERVARTRRAMRRARSVSRPSLEASRVRPGRAPRSRSCAQR